MAQGVATKTEGRCPDRDALIQPRSKLELGRQFFCPECGNELVVVSLNLLEFDWALGDDDGDDYDDDDWD